MVANGAELYVNTLGLPIELWPLDLTTNRDKDLQNI